MHESNGKNFGRLPQQLPVKPALFHWLNQDWILGFLLFVVTLFAYQPAWNGKPIWDDDDHITMPNFRSFAACGTSGHNLGLRTVLSFSTHRVFWLEYHLWGDSTLGYHLVNILLHLFSALLLVCILRRLVYRALGSWRQFSLFIRSK